jgi:circadian clock protein KaiB
MSNGRGAPAVRPVGEAQRVGVRLVGASARHTHPVRTRRRRHRWYGPVVPEYMFELYVAGDGYRSRIAVDTFTAMCDDRLPGRYDLVVIDVLVDPERAERAKILATPTLLRRKPAPDVRIIGDLTLTRSVLAKLGVPQESARPERHGRPPT